MYTSPGTTLPVGGASIEKNNTRKSHCPAQGRLSFKRAQAKREHLKVALLAERHARGPDG